jgi:hypothetical protein
VVVLYGVTGVLEYLLGISPTSDPMPSTSLEGPGSIYSDPKTQVRLKTTFTAIVDKLIGRMTSEKLV